MLHKTNMVIVTNSSNFILFLPCKLKGLCFSHYKLWFVFEITHYMCIVCTGKYILRKLNTELGLPL